MIATFVYKNNEELFFIIYTRISSTFKALAGVLPSPTLPSKLQMGYSSKEGVRKDIAENTRQAVIKGEKWNGGRSYTPSRNIIFTE